MIPSSDPYIGKTIGYYKILDTAGRNGDQQKLYLAECTFCHQRFTKVISSFKRTIGKEKCSHRLGTERHFTDAHPCMNCGKLTQNIKFCSIGCSTAYHNRLLKRKEWICEVCGKPAPPRRRFCSQNCINRYRFSQFAKETYDGREKID